jgi:MFE-2 hydratase 2 N-terminal domain/MaoC like domain
MPINPDAVGARSEPARRRWDSKDSLLYAIGVGAGAVDPLDELEFTTENSQDVTQRALPTMAVVLGAGGMGAFAAIGPFNPVMLVHGEESITLAREIPAEGELEAVTEIVGIWDKGSGALVQAESTATLVDDGQPLFTVQMGAFLRGEGGWGGDRGPSSKFEAPEREPDHEVTYPTRTDQALLYRLSGDRNPLHSDPKFAAIAGFDRPILHGLCTYGFTGRAARAGGRRPGPVQGHERALLQPGVPGRGPDRAHVGDRRRRRRVPDGGPRRPGRPRRRPGHRRLTRTFRTGGGRRARRPAGRRSRPRRR